jgi:hypothetical protein
MNADTPSWMKAEVPEEAAPDWISKPTHAEETKIVSRDLTTTEKEELHTLNYELVPAESPRDVVMSETMRPRSQKGAGNIKAVAVSFRTIRYSYDYIIKQPVNLTLCANALLTFAIDRLHELKKQVQILTEKEDSSDKLVYQLIDAESPRDLVCSDSMRPRSKKTSSDKDAVQIGFKADAGVYDWLIKQPVNMALCGNALMQFAIDTLREENMQVKILSNKGKR